MEEMMRALLQSGALLTIEAIQPGIDRGWTIPAARYRRHTAATALLDLLEGQEIDDAVFSMLGIEKPAQAN